MIDKIMTFLSSDSLSARLLILVGKIGLILGVGTLIIKIVTKYVHEYLDKHDTQHAKTVRTVLISFTKYLTYFFMITAILSLFGVNVLSIMAVAGIGSVAIGFGAQTFVKDVISGAFILLEEQYQVDDLVTLNGFTGRVEAIGLRTTTLRNITNNEVYIIPNGSILSVTNKTKDFQKVTLLFHLDYVEDLDKLKKLVSAGVSELNGDKRLLSNVFVNVYADNQDPLTNVSVTCNVLNNESFSVSNDLSDITTKVFHDNNYKQVYLYPLANLL